MGVYLECPQCKNESINHDDEAFHLDQNVGDGNVLCCDECEWVGNVYMEARFEKIERKDKKMRVDERVDDCDLETPQELIKSAIDRIIKERQEKGVDLLPKECEEDQKEEAKKHDAVNHPNHYTQGRVECIDALESATINKRGIEAVCTANIIKYLWRYESKNGIEDVKKAQWYLQRLIKELETKTKE